MLCLSMYSQLVAAATLWEPGMSLNAAHTLADGGRFYTQSLEAAVAHGATRPLACLDVAQMLQAASGQCQGHVTLAQADWRMSAITSGS